jgi:hypothetical protein
MGLFLDSGDYLPVSSNRITFGAALNRKRLDTLVLKAGFMLGTAAWFALAVYGAWIVRRRALELLPIWSFPVYLAVAHLPMAIEPRYGLPSVPFLTIFAAVAITAIVASVQGRSASQPAASAAGTATGVASAPA